MQKSCGAVVATTSQQRAERVTGGQRRQAAIFAATAGDSAANRAGYASRSGICRAQRQQKLADGGRNRRQTHLVHHLHRRRWIAAGCGQLGHPCPGGAYAQLPRQRPYEPDRPRNPKKTPAARQGEGLEGLGRARRARAYGRSKRRLGESVHLRPGDDLAPDEGSAHVIPTEQVDVLLCGSTAPIVSAKQ